MADFIPDSDADFDAWFSNFSSVIGAAPTTYGETTVTASALDSAFGNWHDGYTNNLAQIDIAKSAVQNKNTRKQTGDGLIRSMALRIKGNPAVTDAMLTAAGLPPRDTTPTHSPVPVSVPVLTIGTAHRLQHTINFADEGTPTSRAKPAGVAGCEIRMKVGGTAPADFNDCEYLATDSRTPYVVDFEIAQAGELVYYLARWISTRQQPGPWGALATATVGAV